MPFMLLTAVRTEEYDPVKALFANQSIEDSFSDMILFFQLLILIFFDASV